MTTLPSRWVTLGSFGLPPGLCVERWWLASMNNCWLRSLLSACAAAPAAQPAASTQARNLLAGRGMVLRLHDPVDVGEELEVLQAGELGFHADAVGDAVRIDHRRQRLGFHALLLRPRRRRGLVLRARRH